MRLKSQNGFYIIKIFSFWKRYTCTYGMVEEIWKICRRC